MSNGSSLCVQYLFENCHITVFAYFGVIDAFSFLSTKTAYDLLNVIPLSIGPATKLGASDAQTNKPQGSVARKMHCALEESGRIPRRVIGIPIFRTADTRKNGDSPDCTACKLLPREITNHHYLYSTLLRMPS